MRKKWLHKTLIGLFLLQFTGLAAQFTNTNYCIRNRFSQTVSFADADIQQDLNVPFGTVRNYFPRPNGKVENLQMDVYYPKFTADDLPKRPLILIIHGGFYLTGARTDMAFVAKEFAKRGFVSAIMGMRQGWGCTDPEFQLCNSACQNTNLLTAIYQSTQDARAAARYLMASADRFRADTAAFFIMGAGTGAMTALNTVFLDNADAAKYFPNEIAKAGLLDTVGNQLTAKPNFKGVINFCGAVINDSIIGANERVPIVNFHDEFDCQVPFNKGKFRNCMNCDGFSQFYGSQAIYRRQISLGICTELNYVPSSLQHCNYPIAAMMNQATCFLKFLMCRQCRTGNNNNPNWPATCQSVATYEITEGVNFSCAPNPTKNILRVTLPEIYHFSSELTVDVVNTLGMTVFQQKMDSFTPLSISVENWQCGVHWVVLKEGGKLVGTRKVMIGE